GLDNGRFSVAAGCVGISQACIDASVKYAKERIQFDRPIGSFQLIQDMIARMVVDTEAARLLVYKAADVKNKGERSTHETSIAKYFASEAALRAANMAVQIHGGYGYSDEFPVERYLRDARVATIYEGTSEIQKLIIGRDALGLRAFV
ncbi:MAG: acyl-CoA dehydrogenase family protein, partial [Planctomycetota bacterium]